MNTCRHARGYVSACLLLLLASCTGSPSNVNPGSPQQSGGTGLSAGPLSLPAPSSLGIRGGSFTLAQGFQRGDEYDTAKPNNRVATLGTEAIYAPAMNGVNDSPTGLAYAVYDFHLPNYNGEMVDIAFTWSDAPDAETLFFALADFVPNRWRWYNGPEADGKLGFDNITPYRNGADHLFLAVAVTGTGAAVLTSIQLSTQQAPVVDLQVDVDSGPVPLTVQFDASGSTDTDGTIEMIEWDFNGDSNFTQTIEEVTAFNQLAPAPVTYGNPGTYLVRVRLTDNDGIVSVAQREINATTGLPPVAALTANATSGPKPLDVDFDALGSSDPDGTIEDYEWDFDGDNNYNEAGNGELAARGNPTPPTVTYTAVGTVTARVRVTDNDGGGDVEELQITVTNAPPVAMLQADTDDGDAPLAVSFDASGSNDPGGSIVDYEWDFDGNGTYNEAGPELTARGNPTPTAYTYTTPQIVTARLRVTDDDSAAAEAQMQITAHGWVVVTVWNELVGWSDFAIVNGNPAVAWKRASNTLAYARSTTALGTSAADWVVTNLPNPSLAQPGRDLCLAAVGGGAAVAYTESPGSEDLYYQFGSGNATSMSDWTNPITVHDSLDATSTGYNPDILIVGGNPMIFYDHNFDLHCVRSSTATGNADAAWSGTKVLIDSEGNGCSAMMVDGNPAVSYFRFTGGTDRLGYCRSSTATGGADADWSGRLNLADASAFPNQLAIVNSNPAVAFLDINTSQLKYIRATNATGSAWSAVVTLDSGAMNYSFAASLGFIGGVPVIAAMDFSNFDVEFFASTTANGTNSADWSIHQTVDGITSTVGFNTEVLEVQGRPAVAYRDSANNHMKYAIRL